MSPRTGQQDSTVILDRLNTTLSKTYSRDTVNSTEMVGWHLDADRRKGPVKKFFGFQQNFFHFQIYLVIGRKTSMFQNCNHLIDRTKLDKTRVQLGFNQRTLVQGARLGGSLKLKQIFDQMNNNILIQVFGLFNTFTKSISVKHFLKQVFILSGS